MSEQCHMFSYKRPNSGKVKVVEVYAPNQKEALKAAPQEMKIGRYKFRRYGYLGYKP